MGRPKPTFKKCKFTGNIYTRKKIEVDLKNEPSTSSTKIGSGLCILDSSISQEQFQTTSYRLIDLELLSEGINNSCLCNNCKNVKCLSVVEEKQVGIASELKIVCNSCKYSFCFSSSKKAPSGYYDSNYRFNYAMRCIGKGRESANILCCLMNMPPPVARFDIMNNYIARNVCEVAKESMLTAVKEVVEDRVIEAQVLENNKIPTDLFSNAIF